MSARNPYLDIELEQLAAAAGARGAQLRDRRVRPSSRTAASSAPRNSCGDSRLRSPKVAFFDSRVRMVKVSTETAPVCGLGRQKLRSFVESAPVSDAELRGNDSLA